MQLSDRIHLVGSGAFGFDLTHPLDCHVYLLDGGTELALVDVGAGMGVEEIVANVSRAGLDVGRLRHLLCTHGHADHAGGAERLRELLPHVAVAASHEIAGALRTGDEVATSVGVAKAMGLYPADYRLAPCQVERELADGDRIEIGDLLVECIDTPGHSMGHLSFLLDAGGRRSLFGGDAVFHGGRILLQNIHDCSVTATSASLRKLRGLEIDALLPGHLAVSLRDGQRHIEKANLILDQLLIPEQIVSGW